MAVLTAPRPAVISHRRGAAQARSSNFRADIEGFRAVAVIMVVLHHLGFPVFGGVDMSFALSGYLMTSISIREFERSGSFSLAKYYAGRARRLLPQSTLVIVVSLLAAFIWLPAFKLKDDAVDALASATWWINYHLASGSTDYFAAVNVNTSPFQHYWSLAVEEQFYVVWPVLLLAVLLFMRRLRLGKWVLAMVLALVVAWSLYISITLTKTAEPWAYFSFQSRAWELALGAFAAVGTKQLARMWKPLAAIVSWGGLAIIGAGSVVISHSNAIPGWVMAWSVVGTVVFIAGGCAAPKFGAQLLLARGPVRYIGRISYDLYLWHWPVLILAPYALHRTALPLWGNVAAMGVALLLSMASYHWIGAPMRSLRGLVEFPGRGLAVGVRLVTASALVIGAFFAATLVGGTPASANQSYADASQIVQQVQDATKITDVPPQALGRMFSVKEGLYQDCLAADSATVADPCNMGDYSGTKQVVLFGSSIAWQWLAPVNTYAQGQHAKLAVFTKGICPPEKYSVPARGTQVEGNATGTYSQCDQWRNDAYKRIDALRPALVIMSSHAEDQATPEVIRTAVTHFRSLGATVVYLGETPRFTNDPAECLAANLHNVQKCTVALSDIFPNDAKQRKMASQTAQAAGATYIDPLPWMCTATVCPQVINGLIVHRDTTHLTGDYAKWLTKLLGAALPKPN